MNFTPLSLFNFEPLGQETHRNRRGRMECAVRLHRIDISKSAYEAIGNPKELQIGTNDDYLAIWGVESGGYIAKQTCNRSSGCTLGGTEDVKRLASRVRKIREIDLSKNYIILSDPVQEDGKLIYNLDQMTVCERMRRRKEA